MTNVLTGPNGNVVIALPVPNFFAQLSGVGGHVSHIVGVIQALEEFEYDVDVVASDPDLIGHGRPSKVTVPGSGPIMRQLWNYRVAKRAIAAARNRPTRFCYLRYARQFVLWIRFLKQRLDEVPLVIEVNSFGAQQFGVVAPIEAMAFASADLLVCVSEMLRDELCKKLGAKLAHKIVVIPNGVELSRFVCNAAEKRSALDALNIGYVGTLKPDYGIETAIQAVRLLKQAGVNVILHIVGEGPQRTQLELLARDLPNVRFRGAAPFNQVPQILQSLDALVYTTSAQNLFQSPIKMYEYMAASRPIVAMRTPATEALIQDGISGLLVPLGSAEAIAEAVTRISCLPDRGDSMGKIAREVVESHSWNARIALLIGALRSRGYSV